MKKIERAAAKLALAHAALEEAVREEWFKGTSLRKIAEAAGVSHEQVRRIVAR